MICPLKPLSSEPRAPGFSSIPAADLSSVLWHCPLEILSSGTLSSQASIL
ncbi:MAG: hypothetical protein LBD06_04890 [Candidatus Accumulibacter sp.]|nr:hypothetical protein [Accumulibacter sp.]